MKTRTVLLSILLAAGALALAPPAQAAEAELDRCPALEGQSLAAGFEVRYDAATSTCHYTVGVIDGHRLCSMFAGVEHGQVREDVTAGGATGDPQAVHAVVNYCYPIIYCTCDPIEPAVDPRDYLTTESAAMQPPIYCVMAPCPGPYPPAISYCKLESATPEGQLRDRVWGTDDGCDVDVETDWYCIYSEVPVDRTVGPVHVDTRICTVPVPIEPAAAAAIGPPVVCVTDPCYPYPFPTPWQVYCLLESATPGANQYSTLNPRVLVWGSDAGCDVDVESVWACAPPSGQVVDRTVGPVHFAILVCDGGLPERLGELIGPVN